MKQAIKRVLAVLLVMVMFTGATSAGTSALESLTLAQAEKIANEAALLLYESPFPDSPPQVRHCHICFLFSAGRDRHGGKRLSCK